MLVVEAGVCDAEEEYSFDIGMPNRCSKQIPLIRCGGFFLKGPFHNARLGVGVLPLFTHLPDLHTAFWM